MSYNIGDQIFIYDPEVVIVIIKVAYKHTFRSRETHILEKFKHM